MPTKLEYDVLAEQYSQACKLKQEGKPAPEKPAAAVAAEVDIVEAETSVEAEISVEEEEMEFVETTGEKKGEASHWATLDTKTMKVGEMRNELEARGQLAKGLKTQLQARLQKCLKSEQVFTFEPCLSPLLFVFL